MSEYLQTIVNEYVSEYSGNEAALALEHLLNVFDNGKYEEAIEAIEEVNSFTRWTCADNLDPEPYLFWIDEDRNLRQGYDN